MHDIQTCDDCGHLYDTTDTRADVKLKICPACNIVGHSMKAWAVWNSCQGGHSDAGLAASEVLGIPFPITMENLVKKAVSEGYDAKALWPWLFKYNDRYVALLAAKDTRP
jgi:hypothetical protein